MEHTYGINNDLTLQCESFIFHVHREIISQASPVFMSFLNGPFVESSTKVITLNEDDPDSLKLVIDIIYSGILGDYVSCNIRNVDIGLDTVVNKYNLVGVRDFITYSRKMDYHFQTLKHQKENFKKEKEDFKKEMKDELFQERSKPGSKVDLFELFRFKSLKLSDWK